MNEVVFGVLTSGSLHLTRMARTLNEDMRLHHSVKRLSRMLSAHSEVTWTAEECLLKHLGSRVTDDMIVAIDPGDLNRDGSPKSECIGRVRDGDKGDIVNGYPLMHVVARDLSTGESLPLLTRLLSSNRNAYRSENCDIKSAMDTVKRHLSCAPLWVIDRGGDRLTLWNTWLKDDYRILVRAANQRFWLWRDALKTAQQIAKVLPLKHTGQLIRQFNSGSGIGPFANLSSEYQTLLGSFGGLSVTAPLTLTLNDLTVGNSYDVQIWISQSSFPATSLPVASLTAGNTVNLSINTIGATGGLGQYVVGTFVADAGSQQIVFGANVPVVNAYQLRTSTQAVPEPDSMFLFATALGALAWRRWQAAHTAR